MTLKYSIYCAVSQNELVVKPIFATILQVKWVLPICQQDDFNL